mmetsp:Transcript_10593/g.19021  ORF Transcript_10593/g.19021 Transcript_10593/m.19021 type:complete len:163 (+) Transcript_10593:239-727(+)
MLELKQDDDSIGGVSLLLASAQSNCKTPSRLSKNTPHTKIIPTLASYPHKGRPSMVKTNFILLYILEINIAVPSAASNKSVSPSQWNTVFHNWFDQHSNLFFDCHTSGDTLYALIDSPARFLRDSAYRSSNPSTHMHHASRYQDEYETSFPSVPLSLAILIF